MTDFLVIGKDGQLGDALVKNLLSRKIKFKAYSRKELDVSDHKTLERIIRKTKPKVILNTSAYHVIGKCEKNPLKAMNINCISVGSLARLSKEAGALFVTYSTNYVFDGEQASPYLENDMPNPLQIYGLSKYAGEINSLNEYSQGTYVIRTCGIYGRGRKGSRSKKGNFVLRILNESKNEKVIKASNQQIVSPTYAGDLAESSINLVNLKPKPGIYHLVNEGGMSWYDFTKQIIKYKKLTSKVVPLSEEEENAGYRRPTYSVLKNIKAKKLGISLPDINSGLVRYLNEI